MPGVPGVTSYPSSIRSGSPVDYACKVQHRSDLLMADQILSVKQSQDALETGLQELKDVGQHEDSGVMQFHLHRVEELKIQSAEAVSLLQIANKLNVELAYARVDLDKTLKHGGDINGARKRIHWLEDRMEKILGRQKQRNIRRLIETISAEKSVRRAQPVVKFTGDRDDSSSSPHMIERPGISYDNESSTPQTMEREYTDFIGFGIGGKELSSMSDLNESTNRTSDLNLSNRQLPKLKHRPANLESESTFGEIPPRSKTESPRRRRKKNFRRQSTELSDTLELPIAKGKNVKRSQSDAGYYPNMDHVPSTLSKHNRVHEKTDLSLYPASSVSEFKSEKSMSDLTSLVSKRENTFSMVSPRDMTQSVQSQTTRSEPPSRLSNGDGTSTPLKESYDSIREIPHSQITEEDESSIIRVPPIEIEIDEAETPSRATSGSSTSHSAASSSHMTSKSSRSSVTTVTKDGDATKERDGTLTHDEAESNFQPAFVTDGSYMSMRSERSHVTFASPEPSEDSGVEDNDVDLSAQYWHSEHHRFAFHELADLLLEINPTSYHTLGIPVPGTFVPQHDSNPQLPWRPKRRASDLTDIHKIALDKLSTRVHKIYDKIHDAAMISVDPTFKQEEGTQQTSFVQQIGDTSRTSTAVSRPTMGKHTGVDVPRPRTDQSVHLPPLFSPRLGTSTSGRITYYPAPIPPPEKLPITKVNRDQQYPRVSDSFSCSVPGETKPAERIVNQRNLKKETQFTSSLYRGKAKAKTQASMPKEKLTLKKFSKALHMGIKAFSNIQPVQDKISKLPKERKVSGRTQSSSATYTYTTDSDSGTDGENDQGGQWKKMKPKSSALSHTGLKWERVKSIVHNNLISDNVEQRQDAARHLGALNSGDAMVMFALRERLEKDDDERVKYEATKSLCLLGCWDNDILGRLARYLITGNTEIRTDIINTISRGKNVQFVRKRLPAFSQLRDVLVHICKNPDPADMLSFDAAVCLGKLCEPLQVAKDRLLRILDETKDTHHRQKAISVLVGQLACREWKVVESIVTQVCASPVWKYRVEAAKILASLGPKYVCIEKETEKIYEQLERRLWNDPNQAVREEISKTLQALQLFTRACERLEKRLEDANPDVRAQSVISLGTLGIRNEKILRLLLEMLELDVSEQVRIQIIRTFALLGVADKRVLRMLKERERYEGTLGSESAKALVTINKKKEHLRISMESP
ncbi:unnamed protein product [Owenia fusiformis]|uniref:Uncharacterized protein n=1 Tax=Owenia fusiformis TaxID=6347 RepID=A0A8J1XYE3_OWEFU|nr:unnamed protein product [Owenia fusiformis]